MGMGWTHNWRSFVYESSDGFAGMGDGSVYDAAPAIAEILVTSDILKNGLMHDRLVFATLAHRWFIESLVMNMVTIKSEGCTVQFRKMPNGSYHPPFETIAQLSKLPDNSFSMTTKRGNSLTFDITGMMSSWEDPNGNTLSVTYSDGKVETVTNDYGFSLTFAYSDNRLQTVTDNTGRQVSYTYDTDGNLLSRTDPEDHTITYEYDQPGRLTRVFKASDSVNAFVTNQYDAFDRVAIQDDSRINRYYYLYGGDHSVEIDPAGYCRTIYYDEFGRTVRTVNELELETVYEYDGLHRLIRATVPEGNSVEYEYYGITENVSTLIHQSKSERDRAQFVNTFTYDPVWNRIATTTNSLGRTTTYTYDAFGNLTTVEYPEVDSVIPTYNLVYNGRGQVTDITGPENLHKSATYNETTGLVESVTYDVGGLNLTSTFSYDNAGNRTSVTDPRGNTRMYEYDDNRLVIGETAPAPYLYETDFEYDADMNPSRVHRASDNPEVPFETDIAFDLSGKIAGVTDAVNRMLTYDYDELGRKWLIHDSEGRIREFTYTAAGQAYQHVDPSGAVVEEHEYTNNSKRARLLDANDNPTTFEYDGFDRLRRIEYADGSYNELAYIGLSHVGAKRTRAGQTISYTYNNLNRITRIEVTGSPDTVYDYDGQSRLRSATNGWGSLETGRDGAGRINSITYPGDSTVGYQYDTAET